MRKIYIDSEYMCHIDNTDNRYREVETSLFDGKCTEFVEGYRFVPSDESWTREDGEVFAGEMISPWKDFDELDAVQREYEREKLADAENALTILYGGKYL